MISSEEGEIEMEMADMEPVELQVVNKKAERKQEGRQQDKVTFFWRPFS